MSCSLNFEKSWAPNLDLILLRMSSAVTRSDIVALPQLPFNYLLHPLPHRDQTRRCFPIYQVRFGGPCGCVGRRLLAFGVFEGAGDFGDGGGVGGDFGFFDAVEGFDADGCATGQFGLGQAGGRGGG